MFWRNFLACLLWATVWKAFGVNVPRRIVQPLSPEARMAKAGKLKYILPRAHDTTEVSGISLDLNLLSESCPYFKEVQKELKIEQEQRDKEIKGAFDDIRGLLGSRKGSENPTGVRDHILSKLNASLTCKAKPECDCSKAYREIDGSCNNLNHPDWGKRDSCLRRVLPPAYADGISKPRGSCNKSRELPRPRLISTVLHAQSNVTQENMTHLAMIFGQFLSHDITFVSFAPLSNIEFQLGPGPFNLCEDKEPECVAIKVPENDAFYKEHGVTRLPILRSLYCPKCDHCYRDQVNSRTSYLDLSHVYGNNPDIQASIRKFRNGLLISQNIENAEFAPDSLFPYADNCSLPDDKQACSWTGLLVKILSNYNSKGVIVMVVGCLVSVMCGTLKMQNQWVAAA